MTSPFPTCLAMKKYHKDVTNIKHFMTQLHGHLFGHICPNEGAKFLKTHARQKHTPSHIEVVLEMLVLEMVEQLGLLLSHVTRYRSRTPLKRLSTYQIPLTVTTGLVCI